MLAYANIPNVPPEVFQGVYGEAVVPAAASPVPPGTAAPEVRRAEGDAAEGAGGPRAAERGLHADAEAAVVLVAGGAGAGEAADRVLAARAAARVRRGAGQALVDVLAAAEVAVIHEAGGTPAP